jgi:alkaline phosphatase D
VKSRFDQTKNNKAYKELMQRTKIVGVWDDHDYGKNDAGITFIGKH